MGNFSALRKPFVFLLFICFSLTLFAHKIKVIATTTLIGEVVKEVGKDKVETVVLVPYSLCPAHFDIGFKEAKMLERCDILFFQGFEKNLFLNKLEKLIKNPSYLKVSLGNRNMMVPPNHFKMIDKIVQVLSKVSPQDKDFFNNQASMYKRKIQKLTFQIKKEAEEKNIKKISVICSKWQKEFLEWLGFKIIATYQSNFSIKKIKSIIKKTKRANVRLVVDNLQSGVVTGSIIATSLKIPQVILSNFPSRSYLNSLRENVDKLWKALEE